MQNDNGRLKIHTGVRPAEEAVQPPEIAEKAAETTGEGQKAQPEAVPQAAIRETVRRERRRRVRTAGERLTVGEKLMRNTAVACALLLTVMALRNVDHPWTQRATEGIRQAMTMRVDWDETLGRLSFVRALVPDTALVFLDMGRSQGISSPVDGTLNHDYTQQQPWQEYRCGAEQAVYAVMSGTVSAIGESVGGDWTVLITDGKGREAVYGYLAGVYVQAGQEVTGGQQIGVTADREDSRLYFEWRENGEAVDPAGLIG